MPPIPHKEAKPKPAPVKPCSFDVELYGLLLVRKDIADMYSAETVQRHNTHVRRVIECGKHDPRPMSAVADSLVLMLYNVGIYIKATCELQNEQPDEGLDYFTGEQVQDILNACNQLLNCYTGPYMAVSLHRTINELMEMAGVDTD